MSKNIGRIGKKKKKNCWKEKQVEKKQHRLNPNITSAIKN